MRMLFCHSCGVSSSANADWMVKPAAHLHSPQPHLSLSSIGLRQNLHRPSYLPRPFPINPKRLLQILISESAHLIWVLRCERTIHNKTHSATETQSRWLQAINDRVTEDKITAARVKRDKSYTALIANTWEPILSRDSDLPNSHDWIYNSEVL
jgi:hypothetical protein